MSTTDGGSSEKRFSPNDKWWEPGNDDLRRARYGQQVGYIREAMANANFPVEVFPPGASNSDVRYMYRADSIITRDDGQDSGDAEKVRSILGLPSGVDKSADDLPDPIKGMRAHRLPRGRRAADALAQIEATLGPGLAEHDYLLHVSGSSCCAATEPAMPPKSNKIEPSPPRNGDQSAGQGVTVAVVDTGVLTSVTSQHEWLQNGVDGDAEPPPSQMGHYRGHGTFVAGVVRSMAPSARVKVFSLLKYGGAAFESQIAPQLVAAFNSGADIISMSAGTETAPGDVLVALQAFYDSYLKGSNKIMVCAAGNDASLGPFAPASQGWPVAVGALNADDTLAGYSNRGPWVDVFARGTDVINAFPNGPYHYMEAPLQGQPDAVFNNGMASWSGTSFATPLVSGVLAARMSRHGENAAQAWASLSSIAATRAASNGGMWIVRPEDAAS
jgi:subtilisin family serine protease